MFKRSLHKHFESVHEFPFSDRYGSNSAQTGYVIVPADPELGRRRSKQRKAVVLGVSDLALEEVKEHFNEYKNPYGEEFTPAGAYYNKKGILRAAGLKKGVDFGRLDTEDGDLLAVALHQMPVSTYMTMGLMAKGRPWKLHRDMLIPSDVEIVESNIEISELSERYPDVPLI